MPTGQEMHGIDLFGLAYLLIVLGVVLLPLLLRRFPPDDGGSDGGGGRPPDDGPRTPPQPPGGPSSRIPLPDAEPAHTRLRSSHDRLGDAARRGRNRQPRRRPRRVRPMVPAR